MWMNSLTWPLSIIVVTVLIGTSTAVHPPDVVPAAVHATAKETAKLREVRIGLAGAPLSLFGKDESPTFDIAFQKLADHGFDFFFPLFLIRETPEQSTHSAHSLYFFPVALTGVNIEQSCGGSFNPYKASLGKIKIWYPGVQLLGLFGRTRPISEEVFQHALLVHEKECPDFKKAVSAFYSFDEPSLNRVVAHVTGKTPGASGNEATVAKLVRQAWDVPVIIVEAPDETTIQTTGLPAPKMKQAVEMFWNDVREVAPSQDGYGFNVYSIPDYRLTLAGDYCRKAKEVAPNQSIVSVIQGMSMAGFTGDPNGGRAPTESEIRFQAVDSLIAGADTLCWYGCSSLDLDLLRDQIIWRSICKIVGELKSIATTLHKEKVAELFTPELGYRCHVSDTEIIVLLVNRSSQQSIIPLDFVSGCSGVEVIAGPEPTQQNSGDWQLECPAYTACIFRFNRPEPAIR
jgi:hypothetical protein